MSEKRVIDPVVILGIPFPFVERFGSRVWP